MFYILEGHTPIPATSDQATELLNNVDARTVAINRWPGAVLSTVFLCVDCGMWDNRPVLFETMLLRDDGRDELSSRYYTWEDAEKGHQLYLEQYAPKPAKRVRPRPLQAPTRRSRVVG